MNSENDTISQANLNGTGGVNLGDLSGTLQGPNGKMYVANFWKDTVSRADLAGTGGASLGSLAGTLDGARGIALDLRSSSYVASDGTCEGKVPCYATIQDAIDNAVDWTTVKVAHEVFNEDVVLDAPAILTTQGGWDTAFTARTSTSTIKSMTISKGTVNTDYLVLQ